MLVKRFLEASRVMLVAGFYPPDKDVSAALQDICKFPHTVLFAESLSNIRTDTGICTADRVLAAAGEDESLYPELLISFGGSLVSRMLKTFLRRETGGALGDRREVSGSGHFLCAYPSYMYGSFGLLEGIRRTVERQGTGVPLTGRSFLCRLVAEDKTEGGPPAPYLYGGCGVERPQGFRSDFKAYSP